MLLTPKGEDVYSMDHYQQLFNKFVINIYSQGVGTCYHPIFIVLHQQLKSCTSNNKFISEFTKLIKKTTLRHKSSKYGMGEVVMIENIAEFVSVQ